MMVEKCFAPSLRALATAVGEDIEKKERFFIEHVQNPEKFRQQQKTVDLTEKEESEENEKEEKKDPSPDQKTITSLFKPSQETEAKEGEKEEETKDEKTEVKQDGEMEDTTAKWKVPARKKSTHTARRERRARTPPPTVARATRKAWTWRRWRPSVSATTARTTPWTFSPRSDRERTLMRSVAACRTTVLLTVID